MDEVEPTYSCWRGSVRAGAAPSPLPCGRMPGNIWDLLQNRATMGDPEPCSRSRLDPASPRAGLGLALPSTPSATIATVPPQGSFQENATGTKGGFLVLQDQPLDVQLAPGEPVPETSGTTGGNKKIHTNPLGLPYFLVNASNHRKLNGTELEGWPSPGRRDPLLLLLHPTLRHLPGGSAASRSPLGTRLIPPADF